MLAQPEELYLGDGFIDMPGAFVCHVLDSMSSRTPVHLTATRGLHTIVGGGDARPPVVFGIKAFYLWDV